MQDVQPIKKAQLKQATEVLTRAFQDNPEAIWCMPNPDRREKKMQKMWLFNLRIMLSGFGEVYVTSDKVEGVAGWVPPGKGEPSLWKVLRSGFTLLFHLGIKSIRKLLKARDFQAKVHQKHAPFPHWHFGPIAVDPEYQGRGFASTLLRAKLEVIDQENLPVYLETNRKKNVKIYEHFGFKVLEKNILPGTEIPNWAMIRYPSLGKSD